MNDADQQRVDQIRAKIRRINGHKQLSPKQELSATALMREFASLTGCVFTSLEDFVGIPRPRKGQYHNDIR